MDATASQPTITTARTGATTVEGACDAPMAITVNGRRLGTRRVKAVMAHLHELEVAGLDVHVHGDALVNLVNDAMLGDWIAEHLRAVAS